MQRITIDQARAEPGWEVFEHQQEGHLAGFSMLKGTEYHCQLDAGFRLRRKYMRNFLAPLLARRGHLTTRVPIGDTANERFNKAFGFERTWSDERFHYFLLTELPFGGGKTCQQ
jgi:hypothetical protein